MVTESELSAERLYEEANELVSNDEFEKALNIYSSAIEKCDPSTASCLYNCYIGRSQANLKLRNFSAVLDDANAAICLNQSDSRAFLKKGVAYYNLKDFDQALSSFEQGKKVAENEIKKNMFEEWINKSRKELPPAPVEPEPTPAKEEPNVAAAIEPLAVEQKPVLPPPIKHEWYQTESQVTVSILSKNVKDTDVTIQVKENTLSIQSNSEEKLKLSFLFHLAYPIVSGETQIKYLGSKIEIKLKKCEAIQWKNLEATALELANRVKSEELRKKPEYPTSSKNPKNWDKIAADVTAEEKDEKLEGDAALNKLFQQIYQNGTEETRRAMNKSFSESGGTVLSTNWTDIGAKKIDVKPPDGMEWKKWDTT